MRAALVFGARNLGRAVARRLTGEGWQVVAVARSADSLERLAAEVPAASTLEGDAGSEADVERALALVSDRFGAVDLVVCAISSGTHGPFGGGPVADASREDFAPYLENLLPTLATVLRRSCRVLAAQRAGTFVLVTGGSARRGLPSRAAWAAAAAGSRALVQSAASELREHGVHVALLVVDGSIENDRSRERLAGQPPEASVGEDDVAAAVAYLADQSPRAWTHELVLTPALERWVP